MRHHLMFPCEGARLAATLDDAPGTTGLLIVSGGNEVRAGAHRGQAMLAARIAAQGFPVFRFDRRGIGDSEGDNTEFSGSAADIAAAIAAFKQAAPHLTRILAFGNCDAATALLLHEVPERPHALILSNPWTFDEETTAPSPEAIRARYWRKLKNPAELLRLFTGKVDLRKLGKGLAAASSTAATSALANQIAQALRSYCDTGGTVHTLAASRDRTGQAFLTAWRSDTFRHMQPNPAITLAERDSAAHSYADARDADWLFDQIIAQLSRA